MALYPGTLAVYIGMVCDYLPFLVLPLYASVEKLDWRLAEAAADLGANGPRVLRHALLPQLVPGLVAGIILVFIPATGQFVIPDLLGGGKTVMLGNVIDQQFRQSRDWPFGAAVAMLSMAMVLVGILRLLPPGRRPSRRDPVSCPVVSPVGLCCPGVRISVCPASWW